jgi:TM2 domain-containing membrane protein YozV
MPVGTRSNDLARRAFVLGGLMVLSGVVLGVASLLLGLENAEWLFVIVFWFGIPLSISAFAAVVLTAIKANENAKFTE